MIELTILDKYEHTVLQRSGEAEISLLVKREYEPGDCIQVRVLEGSFYELDLDPCIRPAVIYAKGDRFRFPIPFGEERQAYPEGSFRGEYHVLKVSMLNLSRAEMRSLSTPRNLSTNPWDIRGESAFYPHCTASVETRQESVFAARNTIDGWKETNGHGFWPFTSWGDNEDPEASIRISFGRKIRAEQVILYLRSDFPHDNYWHHADLVFDETLTMPIELSKTGEGQVISLPGILCEQICLCHLKKDEKDPSPFPALTLWEVTGCEAFESEADECKAK